MAGLALGSYLFGRWSDSFSRPVILLLIIEGGLALFALTFRQSFSQMMELYQSVVPAGTAPLYQAQLLRFLFSFIYLLIPTTLMGGIIPVIGRYFIDALPDLGNKISWVYALNNFGAALGCFFAGFLIIRLSGLQGALFIAAGLNLVNFVLAVPLLSRRFHSGKEGTEEFFAQPLQVKYPPGTVKLVLWVFALEGFTTLAYEVIWTRVFIDFAFEKTVYFYTTVVFSFILGLGLGSFLIRRRIDKIRAPVSWIASIQVLIGLSSLFLFVLFMQLSPSLVKARDQFETWLHISGREYGLMLLFTLPPAILMGMTYPLVAKVYANRLPVLGKRLGNLGFLDTVGSIVGSIAAGLVMIPFLGIYYAFLLTVLINLLLGNILIWRMPRDPGYRLWRFSLPQLILLLALFLFLSPSEFLKNRLKYYPGEKIIYYNEGLSGTVSVHLMPNDYKALAINGAKTAFSNSSDLRVHTLLAYLPWVFHPEPRDALVIGFGMGVTTDCLVQDLDIRTDVAELSASVVEAADSCFGYLNHRVLEHEKVDIHLEDGRSFLLRSGKEYDIITSNAVHPKLSANLYTREFYELCKSRITENGLVCQWLPNNWVNVMEFKSLILAINEVFPYTSLWYVTRSHLLLLGSKTEPVRDLRVIIDRLMREPVQSRLQDVDIPGPASFMGALIATQPALERYARNVPVNTDDHPLVEFSTDTRLMPNTDILQGLIAHFEESPGLYDAYYEKGDTTLRKEQIMKYRDDNFAGMKSFVEIYSRISD